MNFKINFVGVGPQKTGSTWLHEVLCYHPFILLPVGTKETFFFDKNYHKGIAWYSDYFKERNSQDQFSGEIGPSYFDNNEALKRIYTLNSQCKIIVTIRNPITKAISLHRHHLNKGRVSNNFSQAIQQMPRIIESGHYSKYLPVWIKTFGNIGVKCILLDDIQQHPEKVLQEVCDFLDIPIIPLPTIGKITVNSQMISRFSLLAKVASNLAIKMREYKMHNLVENFKKLGLYKIYSGGESRIISLTENEYSDLIKLYDDDISFVENLMSRDLSHWRTRKSKT